MKLKNPCSSKTDNVLRMGINGVLLHSNYSQCPHNFRSTKVRYWPFKGLFLSRENVWVVKLHVNCWWAHTVLFEMQYIVDILKSLIRTINPWEALEPTINTWEILLYLIFLSWPKPAFIQDGFMLSTFRLHQSVNIKWWEN